MNRLSDNSEKFIIREFTQKDLIEIGYVIIEAMASEVKKRNLSAEAIAEYYAENIPEKLSQRFGGNYFYVAENTADNRVIGVIGLRKDDKSTTHNRVSTFNVSPDFQKKGVGSLLYQRLEQTAIKIGCKKLVVSSSLTAEPIYKHWGFKKLKEKWYSYKDGSKYCNIWMEKDI